MKTVIFKSASGSKINLLKKVAKEMGIGTETHNELTDEEMAIPGPKPTKKQLENWLAKDDGEKYGINEAFKIIKTRLHNNKDGN